MMAAVWLAAYQDQTTVAGFSLAEMLAYTVGVMILRTLITVHIEHGIDLQIRQGELSNHLVRPFNIWAYWFVDSLGWKMFRNAALGPGGARLPALVRTGAGSLQRAAGAPAAARRRACVLAYGASASS